MMKDMYRIRAQDIRCLFKFSYAVEIVFYSLYVFNEVEHMTFALLVL